MSSNKIKPLHRLQIDINSILLVYVIGNDITLDYYVYLTKSVLSSIHTNDIRLQELPYIKQNLKSIIEKLRRQISLNLAKKHAKEKELYLQNQQQKTLTA